ncbi:MAG: YggS family pyridoxal phosphate-dependent enzyme [Acidobacteria bacterium]|nr:MAG: YggS family pyridoxal phosphate-dependent enzyme [Acidobacteriota bacterium]
MIDLKDNIARVQERIAEACRRVGRRPEDVKLVAVSKTVPPDRIRAAYDAGLRDFGENRVQEANAKRAALSDLTVTWHLVGHLQSNKAKLARELFHWAHSLDSLRLAQKLDQAAVSSGDRLPVLIEVNLGEEQTKSGVREQDVLPLAEQVSRLPTLELRGLMVLPPFFEDPEQARPFFGRLRDLAKTIEAANSPGVSMRELSMGMSHDFEVAIEEGATTVRIGTAIFGERK